jgi:hypothetical protein
MKLKNQHLLKINNFFAGMVKGIIMVSIQILTTSMFDNKCNLNIISKT